MTLKRSDTEKKLTQMDSPAHKSPLAAFLFIKMQNLQHVHERLMARFLERRGWVAFYLDERARTCSGQGTCWLGLYEQSRRSAKGKEGKSDEAD